MAKTPTAHPSQRLMRAAQRILSTIGPTSMGTLTLRFHDQAQAQEFHDALTAFLGKKP